MARKDINEELAAEARRAKAQAAGKGKPTPKRKDQEAAHQRALVPTPRRAPRRRESSQGRSAPRSSRRMLHGDERNMPAEHRGPERRFMRDFIDARTGLGEYLMPASIMFVVVFAVLQHQPQRRAADHLGVLRLVFVGDRRDVLGDAQPCASCMAEKFWRRRRCRAVGASTRPRRMLNLRRLRVPRPMVKRGEYPV